jgi:hypothetical protein
MSIKKEDRRKKKQSVEEILYATFFFPHFIFFMILIHLNCYYSPKKKQKTNKSLNDFLFSSTSLKSINNLWTLSVGVNANIIYSFCKQKGQTVKV